MNVLGIETSCDETGAAIVKDGRHLLSNVVASQAHLHARYGGVVPEVAARQHLEALVPVVEAALKEAGGRGVRVRLLGSPKEPGDTYFLAGALRLKEAGALVRFLPDPYVHAKVLVRDGEEALLGSLNLSANSIQANRELAVRFTAREAPEAFRRLLSVMEGDWEKALPENPFALPPVEGSRAA